MTTQTDDTGKRPLSGLAVMTVVVIAALLGTWIGARVIRPESLIHIPDSMIAVVVDPGCSFSKRLIALDQQVRQEHGAQRNLVILPARPGKGIEDVCRAEQESLASHWQPWLRIFAESVFCRALFIRATELESKYFGTGYPYFVENGAVIGKGLTKESLSSLGQYGELLVLEASATGVFR